MALASCLATWSQHGPLRPPLALALAIVALAAPMVIVTLTLAPRS